MKTATAPHSAASDFELTPCSSYARCLRALLVVPIFGCAIVPLHAVACGSPEREIVGSRERSQLLGLEVNGIAQAESVRAIESLSAGLLLSCIDLQQLQVRVSDSAQSFEQDGEMFVSVRSIAGLRAQVDAAAQRVALTVSPSLLPRAQITLSQPHDLPLVPAIPSLSLRYDLYGSRVDAGDVVAAWAAMDGSAGSWHVHTDIAARDLAPVRLETSVSRDWPGTSRSLRLGDVVSTAAGWSNGVRLGGIHWGTDFSLRPDAVTFPLPAMRGAAVVPSVVDVYVNGALRTRRRVDAGEFALSDLPAVTGRGNLRLVVEDAFGRRQVIEQAYFVSDSLLRRGLSSYSVDLGFLRESFGFESFKYGTAAGVVDAKRGVTDWLTASVHAEATSSLQTAGMAASVQVPGDAILSIAAARSAGDSSGVLAQVGLDITRSSWNAGARWRATDTGFREPGSLVSQHPSRSLDLHLGVALPGAGALGLVLSRQSHRQQESSRFASASYSIPFGVTAFLTANASCGFDGSRNCQYNLMLTRPLPRRNQLQVTTGRADGVAASGFAVSRAPDGVAGIGYRLQAESAQQTRFAGEVVMQTPAVRAQLDVEHGSQMQGYSLGVSGGVLLAGTETFVSRDTGSGGSIALVQGPPIADVPIYLDGRVVARTAENGRAVVTGLRAFEVNRLHLDESYLPLGMQLAESEIVVVPARNSVIRVRFDTSAVRGATLRLVRENGAAVPSGAKISTASREFVVADGGASYLVDLHGSVVLDVTWSAHRCEARVEIPVDEILPDLGPQICREIL